MKDEEQKPEEEQELEHYPDCLECLDEGEDYEPVFRCEKYGTWFDRDEIPLCLRCAGKWTEEKIKSEAARLRKED